MCVCVCVCVCACVQQCFWFCNVFFIFYFLFFCFCFCLSVSFWRANQDGGEKKPKTTQYETNRHFWRNRSWWRKKTKKKPKYIFPLPPLFAQPTRAFCLALPFPTHTHNIQFIFFFWMVRLHGVVATLFFAVVLGKKKKKTFWRYPVQQIYMLWFFFFSAPPRGGLYLDHIKSMLLVLLVLTMRAVCIILTQVAVRAVNRQTIVCCWIVAVVF